jgi:hypothetical protein
MDDDGTGAFGDEDLADEVPRLGVADLTPVTTGLDVSANKWLL